MAVPPLYLCDRIDSYISGEVKIHPSAVVAPGVIFQAAPNSRIVISQGVCIGMGAILKVESGTLLIEAGVSIGAGFLMVGSGTIGANSCIGAATTVFNSSVPSHQVIPPGSIMGDQSRTIADSTPIAALPSAKPPIEQQAQPQIEPKMQLEDDVWAEPVTNNTPDNTKNTPFTHSEPEPATSEQPQPSSDEPSTFGTNIYGQSSVQRLLVTLFPHRQSLNKPLSGDE
jgi:carbon dioxide concentrating mechanism protein CcmN